MTVLYGTSVSDTTLTTANKMASASGGTETSALTTTAGGSGNWCEILPRGGTSTGVVSIPATPTGNGWVFSPGAGTFATGNWSAIVTLSGAGFGASTTIQIRFSRYSSGTYTVIGSLPALVPPFSKTANSFTATSMSSITFAAGDLLYVDLWINDTTGIGGDNPTVYEGNSATAGVASDMQVTTSTFTSGGGGGLVPTALHVYGTSVAATTVTTAGKLATATGGTSGTKTTKLGKLLSWGEIYALGNTGTWPAGASAPNPSGHGWLLDATTLEGQAILAGTWTPIVTLSASSGTATADIHIRAYVRSSAGVFTLILDLVKSAAAIGATATAFSPTAASGAQTSFGTGDKLYIDCVLDVTANTSASTTSTVSITLSTTSTGIANDLDVNTPGYTLVMSLIGYIRSTFVVSAGNVIVGLVRAGYLVAIAQKGVGRSKFTESIGSFGRSRSKFTTSIGSKQASRSKFLVSIGQKGVSRSKFVISKAIKGLSRSKFVEAATQKSQARSKFLISFKQAASSRAKFLISIAQRGITRSTFVISKSLRGLARSKFAESIAQKGRARSKFLLSAVMKGLAESTFKIAIAGGHAISAYMRSRYKVSIRQTQVQRSKFLIRFSQSAQAHSKYLIRFAQAVQSRTRFFVRFGITGRARSRYFLSIRQTALARSRFITRLALLVRARSKFLVQSIVVIYPIKSITHAVSQALSAAWNVLEALGLVSSHASALTITHQELAMPAPNSTILPTITVTDISGALVSNASAVSLVVYFPDGSTSNLSLTSGITNLGAGQYQAKYNTKGPGEIREVWSIIAADGTTLASAQFLVGVEY